MSRKKIEFSAKQNIINTSKFIDNWVTGNAKTYDDLFTRNFAQTFKNQSCKWRNIYDRNNNRCIRKVR